MAISVVQSTRNDVTSNSTTISATFGSATTAGNCVVVCVTYPGFISTSVTGVTLGGAAGNFTSAAVASSDAEIWVDPNCAGGQTSVVATYSSSGVGAIFIYEVSGLAASSVVDKTSTNTSGGSSWTSGTTATLTQATEIAFGICGYGTQTTLTGPGGAWVNATPYSSVAGFGAIAGYNILSATTGLAYTGTSSINTNGQIAIATLKAGGAAGGPARPIQPGATWRRRFHPTRQVAPGARTPGVGSLPHAAQPANPGRTWRRRFNYPEHITRPASGWTGQAQLGVSTVAIATPAPTPGVTVALQPCTLTIATPAITVSSSAGAVLGVSAVTIGTPAPGLAAGPVQLGVSTVSIATPGPTPGAAVPLGVCTVTIGTPAPLAGVTSIPLGVAPVTIGTPAITPAGMGVKLGVSTVSIAAYPFAISVTVPLAPAAVTIATPQPGIHKGSTLALGVCSNTIAVYPVTPVASRNLLVSLASEAGTDDFGNAFPAGLMTTTGIIEGTTISGSVFEGTDFVIGSDGMFLYSGTPAAGNLVISLSQNTGTDSFGNEFLQGYVSYQSGFGGQYLATQVYQGTMAFWESVTYFGWVNVGASVTITTGGEIELQGSGIQLPSNNINGYAVSFAFLSTIGQMSHLGSVSTSYSTSGIGTISGTPTAAEYNALNTAYNNTANALVTFAGAFNTLLTRLQNENYMA